MDSVGVRELRQNLSVYLRRVEAGESLEVLSRGRVVAELRPASPDREEAWQAFLARPDVRPATRSLADLPPPADPGPGPSMQEVLDEIREDRV